MEKSRRYLSILLAAIVCIGLFPVTGQAYDIGVPGLPSIGVDGEELAAGIYYLYQNKTLVTEGADNSNYHIYYDEEASKLTLNNVTIDGHVLVPGGTTIEIIGTVSIDGGTGIQSTSDGDVTVTGEDSAILTVTTQTEGILIPDEFSGTIELSGGITVTMNCGAYAINNCKEKDGGEKVGGSVNLTSTGSQPAIGTDAGDITICDQAQIAANSQISTSKGNIYIQDNAVVTVDTAGIAISADYGDKIEITDAARVTAKGSTGINAFSGSLLVDKKATLCATATGKDTAAISIGLPGDTIPQTVQINGTVDATGFVGIGVNNKDSGIVIDGGTAAINSKLAGLYLRDQTGTASITNGADVSITSEQYGVFMAEGAASPEIENSTITISSGEKAFLRTVPTFGYDVCQRNWAGDSEDTATAVATKDMTNGFAASKYLKVMPAAHTGGTATHTDRAICENCGQAYGELAHEFSSAWTSDASGHWHACTCGAKADAAAHTPGAAATGTTPQTCTVCGYVIAPATGGHQGGGSGGGGNHVVISFDTNGGDDIKNINKNFGSSLDLSDYTPMRDGYIFQGWYLDQEMTKPADDVKLTNDTKIYAKWEWDNPFGDISKDEWFYSTVEFVYTSDLMKGTDIGQFSPNSSTTRGQIAAILWRLAGSPDASGGDFSDVASETYYAEAVRWADSEGIVNGYGNDLFGPDDPITREQFAVMLYNYAGKPAAPNEDLAFRDWEQGSDYAQDALRWAVSEGIISGKPGNILDPRGQATRAQVAVMLQRFLEK